MIRDYALFNPYIAVLICLLAQGGQTDRRNAIFLNVQLDFSVGAHGNRPNVPSSEDPLTDQPLAAWAALQCDFDKSFPLFLRPVGI